ncbi:MAG: hypothetical protein ACRDJW_13845 [Thermomicrobiales bacterium]
MPSPDPSEPDVLKTSAVHYDGAYYAAIGDFLGERYLDDRFTKGTIPAGRDRG